MCSRGRSRISRELARLTPELFSDGQWADVQGRPPRLLIRLPVELAMVGAAERDRELVADLAAQRDRLGDADVVRVGRSAPAHDAGLLADEAQVKLVATAHGLA